MSGCVFKYEWSKEDLGKIFSLYNNEKKSLTKIAEIFGVSRNTIGGLLKENNLEIRGTGYYSRKYEANFNYFKKINTQQKAYWLGFIAADGCIVNGPNHNRPMILTIGLSSKDKMHLEKFLKCLESTHPIIDSKDASYINICNENFVKDIVGHNITPKKSHTIKPINLGKIFMPHFWRGVFDGDGCLHFRKSDKQWCFVLSGSLYMLQRFSCFAKNICATKASIRYSNGTYNFKITGNKKVPVLVRKIYENSEIHLDRKYNLYKKMLYMMENKNE